MLNWYSVQKVEAVTGMATGEIFTWIFGLLITYKVANLLVIMHTLSYCH